MGNALLTVAADKPFLDPAGVARKARMICEDTFTRSNDGWMQLSTFDSDKATGPDYGQRIFGTLSRVQRGPHLMALRSPGIADYHVTDNPGGIPLATMGIKRLANLYGDGRYLIEMALSFEFGVSQTDRPIDFGFGLDVANAAGTRRFFRARFWNYDEENNVVRKKFQIKTGAGSSDASYTDVVGGAIDISAMANENKALPFYTAIVINTATGKWEGFRFGNLIKVGTLAETPDTSLIDLGAVASESLPTFANGLNPFFDIVNRASAARTQAGANLHWHRLSFLGA